MLIGNSFRLKILLSVFAIIALLLVQILARDKANPHALDFLVNANPPSSQYHPEQDLSLGGKAPTIQAHTLDDQSFSDAEFTGHTVRLLFVADCTPCIEGTLTAWNRIKHDSSCLDYILSAGGDGKVIHHFLAMKHLQLNVLLDENGQTTRAFNAAWLPRAYLIDPHGKIRYVQTPQDSDKEALEHMQQILGGVSQL